MSWLKNLLRRLFYIPPPYLEIAPLLSAKQCLNTYEESRAKRILPQPDSPGCTPVMAAAYALQENEARLLFLAIRGVVVQIELIHAYVLSRKH
jgi:hypothetical protein